MSIHDYTNRGAAISDRMSRSDARVEVYQGSRRVSVFPVPKNRGGTLWKVFELRGNTISPINAMSYHEEPSAVQSLPAKRLAPEWRPW